MQTMKQGQSVFISSPAELFDENTLVEISLKTFLYADGNGIVVYLNGSLGLIQKPLLIHGLSDYMRKTYNIQEGIFLQYSKDLGERHLYRVCLPGGYNVQQSLVFQAVYSKEDTFAIESVNNTGLPCNLTEEIISEGRFSEKYYGLI